MLPASQAATSWVFASVSLRIENSTSLASIFTGTLNVRFVMFGLAAWKPSVLVTQLGCDTHRLDPLAHLACTVDGQRLAYARMHTLRSPKHFTGPDLDIPSLTYQSWHEARFGEQDWQNLDLISRELWAEYLLWFRRVVDLPVRNGCEVIEISPAACGLLAAKVLMKEGGVIQSDAPRHPLQPLNPAIRAGLIETARRRLE